MTTPSTRTAVPDRVDRPRSPALGSVAVGAVVAFLLLMLAVVARWRPLVHDVDDPVGSLAHRSGLTHPVLADVARVASTLGSPTAMDLVALAAVIGLLATRRVRAAVVMAAARLLELGIETAVKDLVDRPRPSWTYVLATAHGASFPSGHSAGSAVVVTVVLLGLSSWGAPRRVARLGAGLLVLFVLAVAASRVVLGVHHLSDVVAGVALGVAVALAVHGAVRALPDPRARPPKEST